MKNYLNHILVVLILLISAKSTSFAISPIFTLLCFLITLIVFLIFNYKIDKSFLIFSVAYFLISLIYFIKFENVDTLYIFYYYILLLYSYLTIKILNFDFFNIYHKIVYYLTLISLPLFILQLLFFDEMFQLIGIFQNFIPGLEYKNDVFANNFFFSLDKLGALSRNSGFAWEPKGFSNFLILAIIINTNLYNFKLNKSLIIFIIGLMTTFSTVGYIIFFTGFFGYLVINNKIGYSFISAILILILGFFISSSDFIYKKIVNEVYTMEKQAEMVYDKRYFKSRSLGRFGSLLVDYNDFINHPIFGYGIRRKDSEFINIRTQSKYSDTKLVRVNGFSDRLATFGLLGMIFYSFAIFKSFKVYLSNYNNKGAFFILIIFFMIEFATNLLTDPLWMVFFFLMMINNFNPNKSNV